MIFFIYSALVLVVFLIVLNGFMRGTKKYEIYVVLFFLLVGLIIITLIVSGLLQALVAIGIAFFSFIVSPAIAARIASKLFRTIGGSGRYLGLPPRALKNISKQLGPKKDIDPTYTSKSVYRRIEAKNKLINYCMSLPEIRAIMKEYQISRDDLIEIYSRLLFAGAGQWRCGHFVAASALAYPEPLRYILSRNDEDDIDIVGSLLFYFDGRTVLEL